MAGTGKSTIARTIAHEFAKKKCLGGSFFFSKGAGDLGRATKLFTTLVTQLATNLPAIRSGICKTISDFPEIDKQYLREQWSQLILLPLSQFDRNQIHKRTLIFVIDALDECEGDEDIKLVLRLFIESNSLKNLRLRILVTSRPEVPIRLGFKALPEVTYKDLALHDIPRAVVQHDISVFLRHELKRIRNERSLPSDWPKEQEFTFLIQKADVLFIYAATVCRFIGDQRWLPEDRLSILLQDHTTGRAEGNLDRMYGKILNHSVVGDCEGQEKNMLCGRFRQIVGSIVILFDTLSASTLSQLLLVPMRMMDVTLDPLHSVLNIPQNKDDPIKLLHPSFRDFLVDHKRCGDDSFWVNPRDYHRDLVQNCLRTMSGGTLRKDICGLKRPGVFINSIDNDKITRCLPMHVQYACQYWVRHLQQLNAEEREKLGFKDYGKVHDFLQENFLHWLEALSLMGKISEGVLMIQSLKSMLEVSKT
jgi:hypothetical protein